MEGPSTSKARNIFPHRPGTMVTHTVPNRGQNGMAMDIRMSTGFGTATLIRSRPAGLFTRNRRDLGSLPAPQSASVRSGATKPISRGGRQLVLVAAGNATLFEEAQNIGVIGLEKAEKLYTSLPDRSNAKHVMLIMHAPWCSHCKAMEPQVRRLAAGLVEESADLSILALECNSPATSAFAKEVLGVPTLPAFCIFPRNCRTFYKFKGQTRDAESLLKFLNMVCNQRDEKLWQLSEPTVAATSTSTSKPAPIMSVSTPSVLDAAPAAAWVKNSPVSIAVMAMGFAAGVCLLVGAKLLANKEEQATGSRAASGDPSISPATGAAGPQEKQPLEHLMHDIDSSLGRLASVMLRLVRARVGLTIARVDDPAPASASASEQQQQPVVDVEAREVPGISASNGSTGMPVLAPASPIGTGGVRRGGATVGAAMALPAEAPFQILGPAGQLEGATTSEHSDGPIYALDEELCAPLDEDPVVPSAVPGAEAGLDLSGLTHEVVNVSGVSADQVLSMLAEEGEDVRKVLQRLLQQQEVQFKVEAVPPHSKDP